MNMSKGHLKTLVVAQGQIFGLWTVIGEIPTSANKRRKVLCVCACNNRKELDFYSLLHGKTLGCKRCTHETDQTLKIGDRVSSWTIVRHGPRKNGNPYFVCKCDCGIEMEVNYSSLRRGRSTQCRACSQKDRTQEWGSLRSYWGRVVNSAKARGIELCVTQDYAASVLTSQGNRCALTGLPIDLGVSQTRSGTASLDRIDSDKGYVEGNVQWVHRDINRMKNVFSQKRFIEVCCLVASHAETPERKIA